MARKAKGSGFSMRSGKRTTFKNMGSSLAINKSGYSNRPDGRAKSSAFQLTEEEKEKIKWEQEQVVGTTTTKTDESTDVTTDYETKGTSKGYTATKSSGEAFRDWLRDNPGGSRSTYEQEASEWRKSQEKTHVKERSETESTPKEKKKPKGKKRMCSCRGQSQYSPGGTGTSTSYRTFESYPCGYEGDGTNASDYQKHPNCIKQTQEQKEASTDRDAVHADGLGLDQHAYSDEERKKAGINFEGKYLGEGEGDKFHKGKGYTQSLRERKASKKKYKELYKALRGDMSDRQWKKYIKNNPNALQELKTQSGKFKSSS